MRKPFHVLSSGVALTAILSATAPVYAQPSTPADASTSTPIKHVVVIFDENVSFDHYFGTYPVAKNPAGEPAFTAAPGTPSVNGLNEQLLNHNPNAANPQRLDRSQPITDDMDHEYTAEQKAFDGGLMDKFVENTGGGNWPFPNQSKSMVMNYYDGNTVTGLWNYAQHFAMSDNSFGTTFGPSTPGALNLVSGQTHGAIAYTTRQNMNGQQMLPDANGVIIKDGLNKNGTLYTDADPYYDNYSNPKKPTIAMTGKNVGDLLNSKGISWGWFQGGFRNPSAKHVNVGGQSFSDYSPHHEPFQYYKSTANPAHLPPTSVSMIGKQDQANHQYDMTDFWSATDNGNMPAVSFLKAPMYQDGHAGYSDPLDEQKFLVDTINHLQKLPEWKDTAVVISYDDSDGWYDHVMGPIVNQSNDPIADALVGPGNAGSPKDGVYLDRAGYGPRLPLLVISPYAKQNFVDHAVTDQSSILRFVEDNWNLGRLGDQSYDEKAGSINAMFNFSNGPAAKKLFLDPQTGEPVSAPADKVGKSQGKAHSKSSYGAPVNVMIKNTQMAQSMDNESPFINKDGHTMVPAVDLASALGASATWDDETRSITIQLGSHSMQFRPSTDTALVDGKPVHLDAPVWISRTGHAYLPLRSVVTIVGWTLIFENDTVYVTGN